MLVSCAKDRGLAVRAGRQCARDCWADQTKDPVRYAVRTDYFEAFIDEMRRLIDDDRAR